MRRHKSKQLSRGPWSFSDLERAIKLDGWALHAKRRHYCYRHPTRTGTIQLDTKWTGVKTSHDAFKSIRQVGGYTTEELRKLLSGLRL